MSCLVVFGFPGAYAIWQGAGQGSFEISGVTFLDFPAGECLNLLQVAHLGCSLGSELPEA
jgi:hypothetical protein